VSARSTRLHARPRLAMLAGVAGSAVIATAGSTGGAASPQHAAATTSYAWTLTPAGQQTQLGDFPMNGVLSRDGRFLVVLNAGQGTESLQVVRLSDDSVIQTVAQPQQGAHPAYFYTGITFNTAGDTLYVSSSAPFTPAGLPDVIRAYAVVETGSAMTLTENPAAEIQLPSGAYPAGLAVDGNSLYVAENLAGGVARVDLGNPTSQSFVKTRSSGAGCATQSTAQPLRRGRDPDARKLHRPRGPEPVRRGAAVADVGRNRQRRERAHGAAVGGARLQH
jgi:hypothetical protein